MSKAEIRYALATSFQEIYDIEAFASMMEFCHGESRVLLYLHMNDGAEIYPSNLSDSLYVTRQRITSVLSVLRKKGFIRMEMAENDRRKMRVLLTDNGKQYISVKETAIKGYFDALIDGLGEKNIQEMTRLINLSISQLRHLSK